MSVVIVKEDRITLSASLPTLGAVGGGWWVIHQSFDSRECGNGRKKGNDGVEELTAELRAECSEAELTEPGWRRRVRSRANTLQATYGECDHLQAEGRVVTLFRTVCTSKELPVAS